MEIISNIELLAIIIQGLNSVGKILITKGIIDIENPIVVNIIEGYKKKNPQLCFLYNPTADINNNITHTIISKLLARVNPNEPIIDNICQLTSNVRTIRNEIAFCPYLYNDSCIFTPVA
ncbi:hypothetical protein [Pseudoalteromonas sp. SR45-4]|uniref:hypothetical protein n=1 Tax=Pseudoalteromonas sp. SR45-4 TaxID=2760929 RepID=UPI0015F9EC5E|nr:hypothetical protein [Pseudoalteromonas sp. SR45-4]MBB1370903.1 hypothetical protein [Pseudoalteromonas sp. SR45-4]